MTVITPQHIRQFLTNRRDVIAHLYRIFGECPHLRYCSAERQGVYKEILMDGARSDECPPGFELVKDQVPVLLPFDYGTESPGAGFAFSIQRPGGRSVILPFVLETHGVLRDSHFTDLDAYLAAGSKIDMSYNPVTQRCSIEKIPSSSYQGNPPSDILLDRIAQAGVLMWQSQVSWSVIMNGPRYLVVSLDHYKVSFGPDGFGPSSGMTDKPHGMREGATFLDLLFTLTKTGLWCIKRAEETAQR